METGRNLFYIMFVTATLQFFVIWTVCFQRREADGTLEIPAFQLIYESILFWGATEKTYFLVYCTKAEGDRSVMWDALKAKK